MNDRAEAMVLASFAADSYTAAANPSRWGVARGEFTTHGQRALSLLQTIARSGKVDLPTLELIIDGGSLGLAAASMLAPLIYLYRDRYDTLIEGAREFESCCGADRRSGEVAACIASLAWNALNSKPPSQALSASDQPVPADPGLESTLQIITAHEGNLREALEANLELGGEVAPRAMIVAMVLGAFHGREAIPDAWIGDMRAFGRIGALLEDAEGHIKRLASDARKAVTAPPQI